MSISMVLWTSLKQITTVLRNPGSGPYSPWHDVKTRQRIVNLFVTCVLRQNFFLSRAPVRTAHRVVRECKEIGVNLMSIRGFSSSACLVYIRVETIPVMIVDSTVPYALTVLNPETWRARPWQLFAPYATHTYKHTWEQVTSYSYTYYLVHVHVIMPAINLRLELTSRKFFTKLFENIVFRKVAVWLS